MSFRKEYGLHPRDRAIRLKPNELGGSANMPIEIPDDAAREGRKTSSLKANISTVGTSSSNRRRAKLPFHRPTDAAPIPPEVSSDLVETESGSGECDDMAFDDIFYSLKGGSSVQGSGSQAQVDSSFLDEELITPVEEFFVQEGDLVRDEPHAQERDGLVRGEGSFGQEEGPTAIEEDDPLKELPVDEEMAPAQEEGSPASVEEPAAPRAISLLVSPFVHPSLREDPFFIPYEANAIKIDSHVTYYHS